MARARAARRALHNAFVRDVRVDGGQALKLAVRGLAWAMLFSCWLATTLDGANGFAFPSAMQWVVFLSAAATVLLGGFLADAILVKHGMFERIALIAVPASILANVATDVIMLVIASLVAGVLLALLLVLLFVNFIITTTVLNRARVVTLILVVMAAFFVPSAVVSFIPASRWVSWVLAIALITGSMVIAWRFPRTATPLLTVARDPATEEVQGPRVAFWQSMRATGTLRLGIFMTIVTGTLGFLVTDLLDTSGLSIQEIAIMVIVAIISLPTIGAILDKHGRKPVTIVSLFLLGINVAFLDGPATGLVNGLRLSLYVFFVLLAFILTAVFIGDFSSVFSRGRIAGWMLFCTIVGATSGVLLRNNLGGAEAGASGLLASLVFAAFALFSTVREPLESNSLAWRDYLVRLHVITSTGLSLFREGFKDDDDGEGGVAGDLEGGGLIGIQAMLQEIAHSQRRIRVLDHGDVQIVFHHGKDTIAVLFCEKDLLVFREKLANFHLDFEKQNPGIDPTVVAVSDGFTRSTRRLANKHFT